MSSGSFVPVELFRGSVDPFGRNYLVSANFSVRQMPYGVLSNIVSQ